MSGNEEYLKLVLNQNDRQHSARMLRYYGYFSTARAGKLTAFQQTLDAMALIATDIEAVTVALAEQQRMLTTRQESLV
ncbi:hypothetical protein, partial [Salmonella sp. SAL4431]|uniref:hypothetical protein n=1 Tax=Salmonella sp. SAL4431 TaxID=3159886 RepID=UPI00397ACEA8